jgi:hypothetical protein
MEEWDYLQKMLHHKPFHPSSMSHQQFLKQTIHRFEEFTYWNTVQEIDSLKAQCISI